jgi:hypothetical protein
MGVTKFKESAMLNSSVFVVPLKSDLDLQKPVSVSPSQILLGSKYLSAANTLAYFDDN